MLTQKNPKHGHPRILMCAEDFARIKENKDDPVIAAAIAKMHKIADKVMDAPCTEFAISDGIRLLVASRRVLIRLPLPFFRSQRERPHPMHSLAYQAFALVIKKAACTPLSPQFRYNF